MGPIQLNLKKKSKSKGKKPTAVKKELLFDSFNKSMDHVNRKASNSAVLELGSELIAKTGNIESFLKHIPKMSIEKANYGNKENKILEYIDLKEISDDEPKRQEKKIHLKRKKVVNSHQPDSSGLRKENDSSLLDYDTLSEVDLVKLKLDKQIDLQVIDKGNSGCGIPKPLYDWIDFGIPPVIYENFISNLKFNKPTLIQSISYPIITQNKFDFIGISPTGTGKTLSYILPIIKKIILSDTKKESISIIIAPTRELTSQIHNQFIRYLHKIDLIKLVVTNPGQDISKEIGLIKTWKSNNAKYIIISTPGRLIDLMTLNNGNLINTNNIHNIVTDECDRLLDLGFAPQMKNILNSVKDNENCSKMLFSATMPSFLENFAFKLFASSSDKGLIKCTVGAINKCKASILQKVVLVSDEVEKYQCLLSFIVQNKNESLVIFVKTQITCDDIGSKIDSKFYKDNNIYLLHAGRSDEERVQVIEDFKLNCTEFKKNSDSGMYKRPILFCTQLLSRGLDIPEINFIIIYNALNSESQYVHTVGRTGRFENESGVCLTLLNELDVDCAQVLYKQIINYPNEKSFLRMDPKIVSALAEMNEKFWEGVEKGKFKNIDQGFTGKGLANLSKIGPADEEVNEKEEDIILESSNLQFDKKLHKYLQSISIDSLPQLIKRDFIKASNLDQIRKKTGSTITLTGNYKVGQGVLLNVANEDKLTVLETMVVLNDAFNSLNQKYKKQQQQKFSI